MSASQLLTAYNISLSQAIKNYNATVVNILKQRMNLKQKQNYLTFLKIQYQIFLFYQINFKLFLTK